MRLQAKRRPSAVAALAASAASAAPSYSAVTNDYYDSCLRYNGWVQLAEGGILTDSQGRADSVLETIPSPPPAAPGTPTIKQLSPSDLQQANTYIAKLIGSDNCDTAIQPAVTDWQHANAAVLGYLAALGKVAGGSKPTDFGFATLTSNVPGLTAAKGSAISTFLNDLFNQYFDIERRGDIATSVANADAAFGTVCDFLVAAATEYKKELARERGEINTFYSINLGQPNVPVGLQRVQLVEYELDWQTKLAAVDQKVTAATAYVDSVNALRKAHAGLLTSIKTNHLDSMYAIASTFVSDFQPKIAAIQKALK
jgi:hypothetical protein